MASTCVNAYAFLNSGELAWPVRTYTVTRRDGFALDHGQRGLLKDAAYALRKEHALSCRGWGFVVDPDPRTVVVPGAWQIPSRSEADGLVFELTGEFTASAANAAHDRIVSGILREGLKRHIKETRFNELGALWQDFGRFCQQPEFRDGERFTFCRSFFASAKRMADERWAVVIGVSTSVIDGYCIADYFSRGETQDLADALSWRRTSYKRRDASPADVRVYVSGKGGGRIVSLHDPAELERLCAQTPAPVAIDGLICSEFKRPREQIQALALHLVVDTQQTEELHSETIIEPAERLALSGTVVKHLQGADMYGSILRVDEQPWNVTSRALLIRPPAIRVRSARGTAVIQCAEPVTPRALHERARRRSEHVIRHGFLVTRPMRPLIGVHEHVGPSRARRLHRDATEILRHHGVGNVNFDYALYGEVAALRRLIEEGGNDTLIAVLPPDPNAASETHERIKRTIEVPSQCMQARNVVPASWAARPADEFYRQEPRRARQCQNRLEAVILNLLVKHNWVPFVPAEPFYYNVHVGLDVGGLHNTDAMACLGYGFSDASGELVFRLGEIPIRGQKKEPIPSDDLYSGLVDLFEHVASLLTDAGVQPDFTRTLFYRDGPLLGQGDAWNEGDAIARLYTAMAKRGWVGSAPLWTALEVMKEAEGLRVFELDPEAVNPTVGRCIFPFADGRAALVNSTGRPYLSQGTAAPLKVRMVDFVGHADFRNALQDFVWQCDLGFTKPDMGFSLPWVLHVADTGALQASRSYKVTGIAA